MGLAMSGQTAGVAAPAWPDQTPSASRYLLPHTDTVTMCLVRETTRWPGGGNVDIGFEHVQ